MSYDLHIVTHGKPDQKLLGHGAGDRPFTVDGPFAAEPDDLPEPALA